MDSGKIRYATSAGGVDIAFKIVGPETGRRVVLVPGFVTHLDFAEEFGPTRALLDAASSDCRLLLFDKRGTGLSGRDLGSGSVAERADDVRAVLDAAEWDHASLLGISEGGPMSMLFAALNPEHVDALALYATAARFSFAPDYPDGSRRDPDEATDLLMAYWGSGLVLRGAGIISHDDLAPPGFSERFERNACTPSVAAEIMRRNSEIDIRELLPTLRVPTLVVHTTGDPAVPVALGRYLADHIDGARFVELPGDFHTSWIATDMQPALDVILEFLVGTHVRRPSERFLATVLFTDIVASTARASELGDRRWSSLLDRHDQTSRRIVERFGGRVVKQTGDGLLATFDGPARAVEGAQTLRDALGSEVPIRAGLHTGEIEQRGNDVGGIAVHIAARVAALAASGDILVSRTVRDLVVGSDLTFEDRGAHELRGVPEAWQLYAALG